MYIRKKILLIIFLFGGYMSYSQFIIDKQSSTFLNTFNPQEAIPAQIDTSYWSFPKKIEIGTTLHTVSSNWYQSDNLTFLQLRLLSNLWANYKRENINWTNQLETNLGFRWEDAGKLPQGARNFTTNLNELKIESNCGIRIFKFLDFSTNGKLTTQILPSYENNTAKKHNKTFMAPGFLDLGLGVTYNFSKKSVGMESVKASFFPINSNTTFVLDRLLADLGTSGVNPAEYDSDGNLIKHGDMMKMVWGFRLQVFFKYQYVGNSNIKINLENDLNLFMDYLQNFGAGQITNKTSVSFPINKNIEIGLVTNLRYFDSEKTNKRIKYTDENGNTAYKTELRGPTIQMMNDILFKLVFNF